MTTNYSLLASVAALVVALITHAAPVQSAELSADKAKNVATLIQQLGADASSDVAVRGKLRRLLTGNHTLSNHSDPAELQEGIWSGVVEHVYVDNLDEQGNLVPGPTQFYLNTGSKHIRVFFDDEKTGHAASGQKRVIRGYKAKRRVLVLESKPKHRDLQRPQKNRAPK